MFRYPVLEGSILSLFAYSSYLLADGLKLSGTRHSIAILNNYLLGICSVMFCGIAMAQYTFRNLSENSQTITGDFFSIVAMICETLVFAYLGMAIFSFDGEYDWGLIGVVQVSY